MKNNFPKETFLLIVTKVTGVTGIAESLILGKSRKSQIVEARHVVRFLCVKSGITLKKTAIFTNCTHVTVISSVRRIENLMFSDRKFKQKIESNYVDYLTRNIRKPVYILGKVTGEPYRKCFEKFEQREKQVNDLGFMAVNPMKLVPPGTPWHEAMRICIGWLVQCFAVCPINGWQHSKGANIEMNIAKELKLEIIP